MPNLLDLSEIVIRSGMRSRVEVDQPDLSDPDLRFAEAVRGKVEFQNSGDLLNIKGEIRAVIEVPCARCLADVRVPIRLGIDEHYPLAQVTNPARPIDAEDGLDTEIPSIVHLDAGKPVLDLDELLRQQVVSELPIRSLCGSACRGLCPQCGADLNQGLCACPADACESPFAALSALLDEETRKDGR